MLDGGRSMRASLGIISPDGTFYPCKYAGHSALSDELCEKYKINPRFKTSEDALCDSGFVLVAYYENTSHALITYAKKPMGRQAEVLDKLIDEITTQSEEEFTEMVRPALVFDFKGAIKSFKEEKSDFQRNYGILRVPEGL